MVDSKKVKILVVDDEIPVCKSIRQAILSEEYEVDTALSGEEALKKDEEESYPIIITDLMMPGISGLDLLERLKARRASVNVIMITGYPTIKTAVQAVKLGAFDYLPKPFTPAELRTLVGRAFKKSGIEDKQAEQVKMPGGLFYMLGHTWLKIEKGKTAVVGIVYEFIQPLASFKQVELPEKGAFIGQGDLCGKIIDEEGLVHRIWSPAAGRVTEVNPKIKEEPTLMKTSPYQKGWLFRLETSNLEEDTTGLLLSK